MTTLERELNAEVETLRLITYRYELQMQAALRRVTLKESNKCLEEALEYGVKQRTKLSKELRGTK